MTCCKGKPLRTDLRRMYGLSKSGNFCGSDCCTHYCCHSCAQCQEAREIWFRGQALETTLASKTSQVITPPPVVMMESLRISESIPEPIRVGYEVALKNGKHVKKPANANYTGLECQIFVEGSTDWVLADDIQDWIKSKIADSAWDGVLAYNDQPSKGNRGSYGHAKGIMVWNKEFVGWLIHSVPQWPTFFKKKGDPSIPDATKVAHIEGSVNVISGICDQQRAKGQSFIWVVFDRKKTYYKGSIASNGIVNNDEPITDILREVNQRVNAIGHCMFAESLEESAMNDLDVFHHDAGLNHSTEFSLLSLTPNSQVSESPLVHTFKTKHWQPGVTLEDKLVEGEKIVPVPDFYRHGLFAGFGPMVTKTHIAETDHEGITTPEKDNKSQTIPHNATKYCDGPAHNFYCDQDIRNADMIRYSIKGQKETHDMTGENDHAKIAYSSDDNEKIWAFVGDMNRITSQGIRAGGGILIKDRALRNLFKGMMHPDHIQPQMGLQYDF